MKKKLEAELMSIAHRVLQMKNKSDINQLCIETQKLHEKLSILRFVEEHFEGPKPTIGQAEVVAKMKQFFEENNLTEVKPEIEKLEIVIDNPVETEVAPEEVIEEAVLSQETDQIEIAMENTPPESDAEGIETALDEECEDIIGEEPVAVTDFGFVPTFELDVEADAIIDTPKKLESIQISFEDLLGTDYTQTHFVRVDDNMTNPLDFELPKESGIHSESEEPLAEILINPIDITPKNLATNERQATIISIGLNDRIAFVKHLFANSDEDYNRVLSQLITFDNFEEAKNFIEDMVKPDYNDWQGKEDYEQRFIEIIEKKFA
jgi:hypothetical protein